MNRWRWTFLPILMAAVPRASAQCERGWSAEFKSIPTGATGQIAFSFDTDGPGFQRPLLIHSHSAKAIINPYGTYPSTHWSAFDGRDWIPIVSQSSIDARYGAVCDPDGPGPLPTTLFAGMQTSPSSIENVQINGVASWDGQTWLDVGHPSYPKCHALKVIDEDGDGPASPRLFAVMRNGSNQDFLFRRDGSQWTSVAPMNTGNRDFTIFDSDGNGPVPPRIYRCGAAYPFVEMWDGSAWTNVCGATDSEVSELEVYDPDGNGPAPARLYAAGWFVIIGGISTSAIAKFDGSNWSSSGTLPGSFFPNRIIGLMAFDADAEGPQMGRLFFNGTARSYPNDPYDSPFAGSWDGSAYTCQWSGPDFDTAYIHDADGDGLKPPKLVWPTSIGPAEISGLDLTPAPALSMGGATYAITEFDLDHDGPAPPSLIVAGYRTLPGQTHSEPVTYFDGRHWKVLGPNRLRGTANALAVFDADADGPAPAELYTTGDFLNTAPPNNGPIAAVWRNNDWEVIGTSAGPANPNGGVAFATTVFDPDHDGPGRPRLFVGGDFRYINGTPCQGLVSWDGHNWEAVMPGVDYFIYAMTVFDDDGPGGRPEALYVAGRFQTAGGQSIKGISRWDGSAWERLIDTETGDEGIATTVYGMAVADLDGTGPLAPSLYVTGDFPSIGTKVVNRIARWDGHRWHALGTGFGDADGRCIAAMDEDGESPDPPRLFVGGSFHTPAFKIARWDGANWSVLTLGGTPTVHTLYARDTYGSGPMLPVLWAGGTFGQLGGVSAGGLARWGEKYTFMIREPISRRGVVGQTAELRVAAGGPGPLAYQWRRNGALLTDGGPIAGATSQILSIANIGTQDAAIYDAVITGPCGILTSDPATLLVCGTAVRGDANGDGIRNGLDISNFAAIVVSGASTFDALCAADLNDDFTINGADTQLLVETLLSGI